MRCVDELVRCLANGTGPTPIADVQIVPQDGSEMNPSVHSTGRCTPGWRTTSHGAVVSLYYSVTLQTLWGRDVALATLGVFRLHVSIPLTINSTATLSWYHHSGFCQIVEIIKIFSNIPETCYSDGVERRQTKPLNICVKPLETPFLISKCR